MAMNYGDMLEAGFAVVTKRRINATTVASSHLVGDVKDKNCVITDDLTSTAGTLCAAAKIHQGRVGRAAARRGDPAHP